MADFASVDPGGSFCVCLRLLKVIQLGESCYSVFFNFEVFQSLISVLTDNLFGVKTRFQKTQKLL